MFGIVEKYRERKRQKEQKKAEKKGRRMQYATETERMKHILAHHPRAKVTEADERVARTVVGRCGDLGIDYELSWAAKYAIFNIPVGAFCESDGFPFSSPLYSDSRTITCQRTHNWVKVGQHLWGTDTHGNVYTISNANDWREIDINDQSAVDAELRRQTQ